MAGEAACGPAGFDAAVAGEECDIGAARGEDADVARSTDVKRRGHGDPADAGVERAKVGEGGVTRADEDDFGVGRLGGERGERGTGRGGACVER